MSLKGREELEQAVWNDVKYAIHEYDMEFGEIVGVLGRVQTALLSEVLSIRVMLGQPHDKTSDS